MKWLIQFELRKIAGRPLTAWVLFGALLLTALFFAINVLSQIHNINNMKSLRGLEAIAYDKESMGRFKGYFTDEYIQTYETERKAIEKNPANLAVNPNATDVKKDLLRIYGVSDTEIAETPPVMTVTPEVYLRELDPYDTIMRHLGRQYRLSEIIAELQSGNFNSIYERHSTVKPTFSGEEVHKLLQMYEQINSPYYYDYYGGWENLCTEFPYFVAIVLGAVVVISLSPVFAEEYSQQTDALILTTRYGKNKVIAAKLFSSFLFVTALYLFFAMIHFLLFAAYFGLDGYNCNIQLNMYFYQSPYNLAFWQFYLTELSLGYIGLILMATITLFLSSKGTSPFISVILSALLLYAPSIDLSETSYLADKILSLFPFHIMHPTYHFEIALFYNLFGLILTQPVAMALTALLGSLLFTPAAYRTFQQHEVK
ncbi:hypothetical protein H1S01_15075 [Heliobacterium chlorum]|uniref:ABC transporter permease n=1 Tax=Heliobacterium chlorum TaxID=2698 RepID=A0ABR7T566_HELCL|nr:hypothetical protein [Heliobacterium chlorum]MBC9785806.1 hypothetical protein [Heliobacterium chlorum]